MFTRKTTQAGALISAIAVLTGTAVLRGGTAAANPDQDHQFLALLNQEEIRALSGVPSLIETAHEICRKLDGGMPVNGLVDAMRSHAFNTHPSERQYSRERLPLTLTQFVTAAVEAYRPYDQGKIASIMGDPVRGSNERTHRVAVYTRNPVKSDSVLREPPARDLINLPAAWQESTGNGAARLPQLVDGAVFVAGRRGDDRSDRDAHGTVLASLIGATPAEVPLPNPPQIPPPAPPARTLSPRPVVAPPAPKQPPPPPRQLPPPPQQPPPPPQQPPPPPQEPPPPPQQPPPPAVGPQPGGGAGSGGTGSSGPNGVGGNGIGGGGGTGGGGGPAEPSTAPMDPGFVSLAP